MLTCCVKPQWNKRIECEFSCLRCFLLVKFAISVGHKSQNYHHTTHTISYVVTWKHIDQNINLLISFCVCKLNTVIRYSITLSPALFTCSELYWSGGNNFNLSQHVTDCWQYKRFIMMLEMMKVGTALHKYLLKEIEIINLKINTFYVPQLKIFVLQKRSSVASLWYLCMKLTMMPCWHGV